MGATSRELQEDMSSLSERSVRALESLGSFPDVLRRGAGSGLRRGGGGPSEVGWRGWSASPGESGSPWRPTGTGAVSAWCTTPPPAPAGFEREWGEIDGLHQELHRLAHAVEQAPGPGGTGAALETALGRARSLSGDLSGRFRGLTEALRRGTESPRGPEGLKAREPERNESRKETRGRSNRSSPSSLVKGSPGAICRTARRRPSSPSPG